MVSMQDEREILDLARQTAERLQILAARLEAYIDKDPKAPDSGKRRRSDDKENS